MSNDSLSAFQGVEGTLIEVLLEQESIDLELVKVTDHGSTPSHEQFSLLLKGPGNSFLSQQIYTFRHERLGELQLFMVPVGQEPDGCYQYEIIFNRMLMD